MTTNKNDHAEPDGDNTGVLADTGGAETIAIPLLGGATAQVSVALHTDDDDDDFEGDVIDDAVAVSFDSLVAGPVAAVAEDVVEAPVEPEVEVISQRRAADAPHESSTSDDVFVIELPAAAAVASEPAAKATKKKTPVPAEPVQASVPASNDVAGNDTAGNDAPDIDTVDTDAADTDAVVIAEVEPADEPLAAAEVSAAVAADLPADADAIVAPGADESATADTSEIAEIVDEAAEEALESAADAAPAADDEVVDALEGDVESEPEASVDAAVRIDTVAGAAHDEDVAEPTPEPQRAVAARPSNDLERVMTRHDAHVMAAKRLDDLSSADRETSDLLTADRLLDPHQVVRPEPEGTWRQFVYSISGHRINLGDSKKARARKALDHRIAASLPGGARFVPVVSRKGGVGKTTITTLLGMALADARDDRVIAVDANPDRGTLSERIERPSGKTVRDLVRGRERVQGYSDVSTIVARDETRLDVLASDTDPKVSEAFSDEDYRHVADIAAHYYSIVLTDTGTGIVHSVMGATLELADQIVVVAGLSVDEARLASETLTWLETNGYEELVRNSIVVLNNARPGSPLVRQDEVEAHFRTRVRDVVRVPYDPQIAAGSAIHFRELQPETRLAARNLAAKVVEGLRSLSIAA